MLLKDLFESNDDDHNRALEQTGFWGKKGAGCIFFSQKTKRFLLAFRSEWIEQPHTWGVWGGAIDAGEDPLTAALREADEESGYTGQTKMIPMYVFKKGSFSYYNYLAIIPDEFTPDLTKAMVFDEYGRAYPETESYKWCEFGKWPTPLHFGVKAILADPHSVEIMKTAISVR